MHLAMDLPSACLHHHHSSGFVGWQAKNGHMSISHFYFYSFCMCWTQSQQRNVAEKTALLKRLVDLWLFMLQWHFSPLEWGRFEGRQIMLSPPKYYQNGLLIPAIISHMNFHLQKCQSVILVIIFRSNFIILAKWRNTHKSIMQPYHDYDFKPTLPSLWQTLLVLLRLWALGHKSRAFSKWLTPLSHLLLKIYSTSAWQNINQSRLTFALKENYFCEFFKNFNGIFVIHLDQLH